MVLYQDAIQQLTRITRILSMTRGHLIFIGLEGSGKKSLIRLACLLQNTNNFSVDVRRRYTRSEFRADIYKIMR
jgi:dynein heavy chain, axonemal